jgi:hypothetical protein
MFKGERGARVLAAEPSGALAWLRLKEGRRSGRRYLSGIMPSRRLAHVLSELENAAGCCPLERRARRHVDDLARDPLSMGHPWQLRHYVG